eukprot:1989698-Ditylum_brightwellii.AAC.1
MTGIIWQNLIKSLQERETINNVQVGERAGCNANTLKFSRKALINFDNDVASYYDQIIPNLANLIGQKKGLHCNITFVHMNMLAEAKFKLKTALG